MTEEAILAIEEALLASLFTQRALVELLIKNGIIKRKDLEHEILKTESDSVGAGKNKRLYFEKRSGRERRKKQIKVKMERRSGLDRRNA